MTTITLRILRPGPDPIVAEGQHVWPLRVVVTAVEDFPDTRVFVFQSPPPGDTRPPAFNCVASVQQMEDIPPDLPDLVVDPRGEVCPYFRLSEVVIPCRSVTEREEIEAVVRADVQSLADAHRVMLVARAADPVENGDEVSIVAAVRM